MKRREFVALAGAALAGAVMHGKVSGSPLGLPFGYQAWELAPDMMKDWNGTLKAMREYGYSYIDLNQVSPYTDRPAADRLRATRARKAVPPRGPLPASVPERQHRMTPAP